MGAEGAGGFALDGFVASYARAKEQPRIDPAHPPAAMSWFDRDEVPVISFLASQFAVCNRWFASLPAGTQPNKMMAMGGTTLLDTNNVPLPNQRLVYNWLNERRISWRVYHDGLPFFAMMPRWCDNTVFDKRFRSFGKMARDLASADPAKFPRVVFIEPKYSSAPHLGNANDDHAPGGVARGQDFLREIYEAISSAPAIWSRSVTIITYDEHGGFYDHVSPPKIPTHAPPGGQYTPFGSLGMRVPAVVVSPYVQAGTVYDQVLDHTSILKFLGSLFGGPYGYEEPVNSRPVGNVLDVLNNAPGGRAAPALPVAQKASLWSALEAAPPTGRVPGSLPDDELERAFQAALDEIRKGPADPEGKFDDLLAAFPRETAGLT
jgi:phospholipase C